MAYNFFDMKVHICSRRKPDRPVFLTDTVYVLKDGIMIKKRMA